MTIWQLRLALRNILVKSLLMSIFNYMHMNTHMATTGSEASPLSRGHNAAASATDQSYRLPLSDALLLHLLLIEPADVSHPPAFFVSAIGRLCLMAPLKRACPLARS